MCMYGVYIYVCMRVYMCMYACVYVYVCVCICVCMRVFDIDIPSHVVRHTQ